MSNETFRAFIALELPEEIKLIIKSTIERLKPNRREVKWIKPENSHVTVKFLGDIPPETAENISQILREIAHKTDPIPTQLTDIGAFPNPKKPRVVWLGLEDNDQRIKNLAGTVLASIDSLGFVPEKKDFSAHITLGRCKFAKRSFGLERLCVADNTIPPTELLLEKITLFKSQLTPQGPIYTRVFSASMTK